MDLQLPQYNEHDNRVKFTDLEVRHLDRTSKQLLTGFRYLDEEHGEIWVDEGFVTDFASVGMLKNALLFGLYALVVGYGDRASTIHDHLYTYHSTRSQEGVKITRKQADAIFYRALRDEGIARWRAGMMYLGVRIGGGGAWG